MHKFFLYVLLIIFAFLLLAGPPIFAGEEKKTGENTIVTLKPGVLINISSMKGIKKGTMLAVVRDDKRIGVVEVVTLLSKTLVEARLIAGSDKVEIGDIVKFPDQVKLPAPIDKAEETAKSEPANKPANATPSEKSDKAKPTVEELEKRIQELEKRLEHLEKLLKMLLSGEKAFSTPAEDDFSGKGDNSDLDRILDEELSKPDKKSTSKSGDKVPVGAEEPDSLEQEAPVASDTESESISPEQSSETVPFVTGKVIGTYGAGNRMLGIRVAKSTKTLKGCIFYVYRMEEGKARLLAKMKVTEIEGDLVGGPIIVNNAGKGQMREMGVIASTRMPVSKEEGDE